MGATICLICRLLFTWIAIEMAGKRNRSLVGWGVFAFFISPLIAWICLAILGTKIDN